MDYINVMLFPDQNYTVKFRVNAGFLNSMNNESLKFTYANQPWGCLQLYLQSQVTARNRPYQSMQQILMGTR